MPMAASRFVRALVVALVTVTLMTGCDSLSLAAPAPSPVLTETRTPTPVPTMIPPGARVAFYGDSYTVGFGATEPSRRWSTLVSEHRDWAESNHGQGGLGFLVNRPSIGDGDAVDRIVEESPDAVVVMLGLNDVLAGRGTDPALAELIRSDIERLSTGLPDAALVIVEPMWFKAERPTQLQTVIDEVRDAADREGALFVAGASRWLDGSGEWMIWDGLHPNDAGYAMIARRVESALESAGL
jgi:lysophospholipase L1-like esterase